MATGLSSALGDAFQNILRNVAPTLYGPTVYVQLHTADPGAAGTTSVSVGSTTRQSVTLAAPASHVLALSAAPTAWTNGGTSETLTHVSVWSASTAGTFLYSAALTSSQAWASGNQFTLTALTQTLAGFAA